MSKLTTVSSSENTIPHQQTNMKLQVAIVLAVACVVISASHVDRPKRGVVAAPLAAAYYAPSYYAASYVAAPSPVVARASRVVGAPGFAARYVAAPVASYPAYTAPFAAPYTVLVR